MVPSVYLQTQPAVTLNITMFHCVNIDVCVHECNQTTLYFKIPDRKYAIGDLRYSGEPGQIVCIEESHHGVFNKLMLQAKNRQESLNSQLCGFHILRY